MLSGADLTTSADIVPSLDMDISFLTIDENRMQPGSSYYCSKIFCYGVNCGGGSVDIAAYPTGDSAAAGFFELHDYLYPNSDESWRECMYTRNDKRAENVCRSLVSEEELSPMG